MEERGRLWLNVKMQFVSDDKDVKTINPGRQGLDEHQQESEHFNPKRKLIT